MAAQQPLVELPRNPRERLRAIGRLVVAILGPGWTLDDAEQRAVGIIGPPPLRIGLRLLLGNDPNEIDLRIAWPKDTIETRRSHAYEERDPEDETFTIPDGGFTMHDLEQAIQHLKLPK